MLSRLRANPVLRAALLIVALAFCGIGLIADWHQVQAASLRLNWYSVGGAFVTAAIGSGCMMLAWRAIVTDLGSGLSLPATVRVMSISQIGKYLPGAIWAFAAQVELGRDYQIPRRRGAAAVVISLAVALATGLLIGVAALPIASAEAVHHYLWMLALAPLIALCLLPPVLRWLLDRAFRLARQEPLEQPLSSRGLLIAVAWTAAGWLLWGLQAWFLVSDLTGRTWGVLLLAVGAYALAWCAGILLVVFPGGIGPRELALVVALAAVMPRGSALLVALASRVVTTVSDVAWAGVGLLISRRGKLAQEHELAPDAERGPTSPTPQRWPLPTGASGSGCE